MDENKVALAESDNRVNFDYLIENKINTFIAIPTEKIEKIVIYCHGLGSNKNWIVRFYEELLKFNIGVVSFDFPGHGEDTTDFSSFDLSLCISYLEKVIQYIKEKYHVPISLFGCSFGGFVILNKLINNASDIEKIVLMSPAINFCEIMERKSGISLHCFKSNNYMPLYNNIKIYKNSYLEFKKGDEAIKNASFKDVYIIQGTKDKTVLYKDIKEFCSSKNLKLSIIKDGKHELYGFEEQIINFLLKCIYE